MVEAIRQGDIPGVQLRCRRLLATDVETAWRWLVEPARLAGWLALAARVETSADGALIVVGQGDDGELRRERMSLVEEVRPLRRVVAWRCLDAGWPAATRLTLELAARPGGCELSLFQEGFEHLPLSACLTIWESYRRRWRASLDRLAAAVTAEASAPAEER